MLCTSSSRHYQIAVRTKSYASSFCPLYMLLVAFFLALRERSGRRQPPAERSPCRLYYLLVSPSVRHTAALLAGTYMRHRQPRINCYLVLASQMMHTRTAVRVYRDVKIQNLNVKQRTAYVLLPLLSSHLQRTLTSPPSSKNSSTFAMSPSFTEVWMSTLRGFGGAAILSTVRCSLNL